MGWEKLEAYVAQLPGGLSAHPTCETKVGALFLGLESYPIEDTTGLPRELVEILEARPDPSTWLKSAHFYGLIYAQSDANQLDAEGFRRFAYEANQALASSALYRALFSMISASTVARMAASTWRFFNRGDTLRYEARAGGFDLILTYPDGLFDHALAAATAGTIEGALSGARVRPSVELVEHSRTESRFEAVLSSVELAPSSAEG
jgi:hypothetical protein